MTIFDLVTSEEISSYWVTLTQDRAPYIGETLFPNKKKLGMDLSWVKGKHGAPAVLKPSALDVKSVPRERIGVSVSKTQMPFFKESLYIDETLRQELNRVLESGNQAMIDIVFERIMDDATELVEGAAAQRERMRQMLLTTGVISITANGVNLEYDYGITSAQKVETKVAWSNPKASIIDDIRTWQDTIEGETGVRPERAECNRKTWSYFLKNEEIRNAILGNNSAAPVGQTLVENYLMETLGLSVAVNSKRYRNEKKEMKAYVSDDVFVMFPVGDLGSTWFGTTPEESDLMTSNVVNVSIVDTGVAVTTIQHADPVNVETKVSQICLPSFEACDSLIIADVSKTASTSA